MSAITASMALASLWGDLAADAAGGAAGLDEVQLTGTEPVLPSSFAVGTAAQTAIALAAVSARAFDQARTGRRQVIAVDMRDAAVECRSERHLRIDEASAGELWDDLAGTYRCGDGRFVRLHTNFAHHRRGVVELLGGAATARDVAAALSHWRGADLEAQATARGLCVAMMRDFAEWDAHPQSTALAKAPLVRLTRVGAAPPLRPIGQARPLAGVRVLELTRIIAGPVAGRTLAAHGADVLRVLGPGVPTIDALDVDTGRGKRSAEVDLGTAAGRDGLGRLVDGAHVVLQSYRPGALEARGFGVDDLAARRPGVVVASLSAYGRAGAWADKRGFDSLVQTATGFNAAEAQAAGQEQPKALPLQILDHASGHLLAAGIAAALRRQWHEGDSWHVEVSLARTGQWLRRLGRVNHGLAAPDIGHGDVADLLEETTSPWGRLKAVRHTATLAATPAHWSRPPTPFGHDAASWTE